nr:MULTISPECIES: ThiF family adenylyltransferase [unclassified Gemella]
MGLGMVLCSIIYNKREELSYMDIMNIKPKVKKAYPVVYMNNSVCVGGFGKITEYADETGVLQLLFESMNGENTIGEIVSIIQKEYDEKFSEEEIIDSINEISKEGFIEDINFIGSEILSEYELSRYHRNINFFSSYASLFENKYKYQKKLSDAKVGIIGLGGLGSHIVYDLAGLGIGTIKAIEFDTVDISNLNRQILYNFEDLGKSKAELAKKRIYNFNPKINFEVVEKRWKSPKILLNVLKDLI